ncbi:uncharacterized protein DFL_007042 [Arthrobotrys flagrans]|uniref:Uncharacterized protein n=1 Tax=Arthrobotrys flagrans TaxID=97331 RepID=A0A436ZUX3_ARTFL|nr:hypothetical protein DFL_007042 [Arthrobotrys flagrans]
MAEEDPELVVEYVLGEIQEEGKKLRDEIEQLELDPKWAQTSATTDDGRAPITSSGQLSRIFDDILERTHIIFGYIAFLTTYPEESRKPRAISVYKKIAAVVEESITRALEMCYRFHASETSYTPVIVQAWSENDIGLRCPECKAPYSRPYEEPPYLGYPLIYKVHLACDCHDSSEPRYYQTIFPDIIHPLTLKGIPIALERHTDKSSYWITLGEEFATGYFRPSIPSGEKNSKSKGEEVDSLAEIFSRLDIDEPMKFKKTHVLQALSKKIQTQIDILGHLRKIVHIFDKELPVFSWYNNRSEDELDFTFSSGNQKWKKKWICKEITPGRPARNLFETRTTYANSYQTGGILWTGNHRDIVANFSGTSHEVSLIPKGGKCNEPHGEQPNIKRPLFSCEELKDRGKELSGYLEVGYEGHKNLRSDGRNLKDVLDLEHYHVEKKLIVSYLHTHGIWYANQEKLRKARRTPDHVLILYLSQQPCEWCQKFMRYVAREFNLCIGWLDTLGHVDDSSVSMTYDSFTVYGFDFNILFPWEPRILPINLELR